MRKSITSLILLLGILTAGMSSAIAASYEELDKYQYLWTKAQIEKRLDFLIKHDEIWDYLTIHRDRIEIYASPDKKNLEYTYYFSSSEKKRITSRPSWSELRVAIDPGHVGGSFGRPEGRYIEMENDPSITFQEGDLNLYTAWALEDFLKEKGAATLLLRSKIGVSSFNMNYEEFLEDTDKKMDAVYFISKTPEEKSWWFNDDNMNKYAPLLFKQYDYGLRKRAARDFNPHITINIHYNACHPYKKKIIENEVEVARDMIGEHNYHMVFVPGSYMKKELDHIEKRQHFFRWLVSGQFEESVQLGHYFMQELEAITGVAPILSQNEIDYFNDSRSAKQIENDTQLNYIRRVAIPLKTDPVLGFYGVCARNLHTSAFTGAVISGEVFCQETDYLELAKKDVTVRGEQTSYRIIQVAQSYFNAIERWLRD